MEISEQNRATLNLFTAQEAADVLKLHPQVVMRKLAAQEISGYKIGKEWRVSESQLVEYLERHSNQKEKETPAQKVLKNFFSNGKLKEIPATRGKRLHVLKHLVGLLDQNKVYEEKELNEFISQFHPDVCTLRREFIICKLMVRKDGKYKCVTWNTP